MIKRYPLLAVKIYIKRTRQLSGAAASAKGVVGAEEGLVRYSKYLEERVVGLVSAMEGVVRKLSAAPGGVSAGLQLVARAERRAGRVGGARMLQRALAVAVQGHGSATPDERHIPGLGPSYHWLYFNSEFYTSLPPPIYFYYME